MKPQGSLVKIEHIFERYLGFFSKGFLGEKFLMAHQVSSSAFMGPC